MMSSADPIARRRRGKTYSVPNLLTYGRVLAVPLVAACLFAQVIYEGGIWLRWVALGIFIVAAITDYFDG